MDWGFNGTSEFQFFDAHVTGVVHNDGSFSTEDSVIGADVIGNTDRPFAKVVDLDTDCQDKTTIYGMQFGISWDEDDSNLELAFHGKWTRAVIAQDMWPRMKCYQGAHHGPHPFQGSFPFGAQGTTIITDVEWGELGDSIALQQLKVASEESEENLSVRVSYYLYTRNYAPYVMHNFTLGYFIGSVGAARPGEPLNFGGERILTSEGVSPPTLSFDDSDTCSGEDVANYMPWMWKAPFKIINNDDDKDKQVVVDLSNSLPITYDGTLRDIGTLHLGVLHTNCVDIINSFPIPYLDNGFMSKRGGLFRSVLRDDLHAALRHSELVVVHYMSSQSAGIKDISEGSVPVCADVFPAVKRNDYVQMMLKETPYFLRPYGYYVGRLEPQQTSQILLLLTWFGEPSTQVGVRVMTSYNPTPSGAVLPVDDIVVTDMGGVATFTFQAVAEIPEGRKYIEPPSSYCPNQKIFMIDGQVYRFKYCTVRNCPRNDDELDNLVVSEIAFLAFSTIPNTPPFAWVEDIQPIFTQYAKQVEIMRHIVDLSSYRKVTLPWNINLIRLSLTQDFEHPNYMPTTRDLSLAKRQMILDWLDNPKYSSKTRSSSEPDEELERSCHLPHIGGNKREVDMVSLPPRCTLRSISFDSHPGQWDPFFSRIHMQTSDCKCHPRPLFKFKHRVGHQQHQHMSEPTSCHIKNLQLQLQLAIELEFFTIPLYLTSLYSIIEGCNVAVYNLIYRVVTQEMLHVAQAANLLISIGGHPVIDSVDFSPRYPAKGLPGGVLPNLEIHLRKVSLRHIYETFMGLEVPHVTGVDRPIFEYAENTIGQFYDEIIDCMEDLEEQGQNVFHPETASQQIRWPWDESRYLGELLTVTDSSSAQTAISQIQVQGEGADPLNPIDITTGTLAHFYTFEQIVCQHRLVHQDDDSYKYEGDKVPFNPLGVWPMRDDPGRNGIEHNSNCYTEVKAFHHVYRTMLRLLHKSFNGHPELVTEAVKMMESLHLHAVKTMYTQFDEDTTCGPVWDYEWDD